MFLGVEMAAFELGVCSGGERFVSDQDLEKALAKVLETFDGVENLSAEQRDGIASLIRRHDVLADRRFYQRDTGNHCYFN